ncbi:MAG: hypothetical protein ACPGNV_11200 [Mangrovicoccus sp.]
MDLLVLGMSHVECIQRAMGEPQENLRIINLRNVALEDIRVTNPKSVAILAGGNQHAVLGLIEHPKRFCTSDSQGNLVPSDTTARQLIPRQVLRNVVKDQSRRFFGITRAIHDKYPHAEFFHVLSPPPVEDTKHLQENPGVFRSRLHLGISPPELRKAIYDLQAELYAELATELGATLLSPPAPAVTQDGFLHSDYCNNDPTHGNTAYGALLLSLLRSDLTEAA